jgi:hypothetical protein
MCHFTHRKTHDAGLRAQIVEDSDKVPTAGPTTFRKCTEAPNEDVMTIWRM